MERLPGPICAVNAGTGLDKGTLARTRNLAPGPSGLTELSGEDRELLLDVAQITLDLAGVIDPTPISDGTNVLVSVSRGDWFGAGLSGLGLIPFIGDLAKAGKLGRWMQTVEKVVARARQNARFAEWARPALKKLSSILEQVPASMLPESVQVRFGKMKHQINSVVGTPRTVARAALIDRYLRLWERHIAELQLRSPAKDRGALWSKLGGDDSAASIAMLEENQTLEMVLKESKFKQKYDLAVKQLTERLGRKPEWQEFGLHVWLAVSEKYVNLLSGRVTVYVDKPVLKDALSKYVNRNLGKSTAANMVPIVPPIMPPILHYELQQLMKQIQANKQITQIIVKDIADVEDIRPLGYKLRNQ